MSISGKAKVAGVVGWPISHSLSPRLHGFWLRELGLDGAYVPLTVAPESFSVVVRGLRAAGFAGINVTNPHKEAAFALAGSVDEIAKTAGAANLLLFRETGVEARNTDVEGLTESLTESLGANALRDKAAVILGAGGAARGAALALARLGVAEIRIVARHQSRADSLVAVLRGVVTAKLTSFPWPKWDEAADDIALVINATSAGLSGSPPPDISLSALPASAAVCDIVYNPLETNLLKDARARGHKTIDGLGMLMHQAVPSFVAFFGVTPKVSPALRADLEKALADGA
jgi:shikimate dehydrogenase